MDASRAVGRRVAGMHASQNRQMETARRLRQNDSVGIDETEARGAKAAETRPAGARLTRTTTRLGHRRATEASFTQSTVSQGCAAIGQRHR